MEENTLGHAMRSVMLLVLCPTFALAAPEPIVVTGGGLSAQEGVPADVVLDRERLAQSIRLEDALGDIAGVQQFRRTDSRVANPTSQGVTLRALGGNAASRALVVLDGVPQADPFTGFVPFSALRPDRLASVRVTRGGGTALFGPGALGGVIELSSGGPVDLPRLRLGAATGSRNASTLSGGIVAPLGAGFVTLSGGRERGDGYVLVPPEQRGAADIPAAFDAWSLASRMVVRIAPQIEVQASGLVFDDHRLRGVAGTASRSRGADASLRLVARGRWGVEGLFYVQERGFRSGFVTPSSDRSTATPMLDQFATPALGLGVKLEIRPPLPGRVALRVGADGRHASGHSEERFRFVSSAATRLRTAGGHTSSLGGYIDASARWGGVQLGASARIDRWTISGGSLIERVIGTGVETLDQRFADRAGTQASLRAGGQVAVTRGLELRAAAYTGFRLPTLNELYRPFRVGADATAANPALSPERIGGVEAGVRYRRGGLGVEVTGFANRLRGAIANVTLGTGPGEFAQVGTVAAGGVYRQRANVDAIIVVGVEADARVSLGRVALGISWQHAHARLRASGSAAALDGKRPAQTATDRFSTSLEWHRDANFARLAARYAGPQFDDDVSLRRLPSAVTIDAVAGFALAPGVQVTLRVENAFDARVVAGVSTSGVQDLGQPRTLSLGLALAR